LSGMKDIIIADCGLSNKEGLIEIDYNPKDDTRARELTTLIKAEENLSCEVKTGDTYGMTPENCTIVN